MMIVKQFKKMLAAVIILAAVVTGCKKDDGDGFGANKTYTLKTKDVLGVTGIATFTQTSETDTRIDIVLTGSPTGTHPAHIHFNSAVESGDIAISLADVDATGKSTTVVRQRDDGTAITYSQLIAFDGYLNVHESGANLNVIFAQGDIGGNELTGDNKSYAVDTVGVNGVSATAKFEKRKNGNSLLTIDIVGGLVTGNYPATINIGSLTTTGPVSIALNSVNGATRQSLTTIRKLDSGTAITYDALLTYAGYLNVYNTIVSDMDVIAHGNIGSN